MRIETSISDLWMNEHQAPPRSSVSTPLAMMWCIRRCVGPARAATVTIAFITHCQAIAGEAAGREPVRIRFLF
jgi:hypothetical protein